LRCSSRRLSPLKAASAAEINDEVNATLVALISRIRARELARKAAGFLVFSSVIKAGIGLGGAYGEGVLIVKGEPAGYYNLVSASFGFQLGIQSRSVIIMFMTEEALAGFRNAYGWKVGVDGSVAIVTLGAGGSIDTDTLASPVIAFILDPQGLMYNLSLDLRVRRSAASGDEPRCCVPGPGPGGEGPDVRY
jgi:lipid-binding SYLF domain-containing protein